MHVNTTPEIEHAEPQPLAPVADVRPGAADAPRATRARTHGRGVRRAMTIRMNELLDEEE
jgi:hypothetical protein